MAFDASPSYSHVGILERLSDGRLLVWHSAPKDLRFPGGVQRQPLEQFVSSMETNSVAIARLGLPATSTNATVYWLAQQEGKPFDGAFDWATSDAFYCTELVSKALANTHVLGPPPKLRHFYLGPFMEGDGLSVGDLILNIIPARPLEEFVFSGQTH